MSLGTGGEPNGGATVLVVEDDVYFRPHLARRIEDDGHAVIPVSTAREARSAFQDATVDAVVLDYQLPDMHDSLELLREIRGHSPETPVIMLTGHVDVETVVSAIRDGAYQYLCKPAELDEVALVVQRALESSALHREVRALRRTQRASAGLTNLIGRSPQMVEVAQLVRRYAESPASTVLVTGESGTGKDVVAHALHSESARAKGPFTNITCSALTETLLESELFGHEKGAFTGAHNTKRGLLELSDRGTAFLDEIGEMSPMLQAKLLRFLESKTCRRVGGTRDVTADVRIVAATNRDLHEEVRTGRFREDLYYRLSVLRVELPPLRSRDGDLPLLIMHFLDRFNREFGKSVTGLTPAAMRRLEQYPWPGNVRELRNVIERAVLLADEALIGADLLTVRTQKHLGDDGFELPPEGIDLARLEEGLLRQALKRTGGNQTHAGRLLGLSRDQVRYRLSKMADDWRRSEPD